MSGSQVLISYSGLVEKRCAALGIAPVIKLDVDCHSPLAAGCQVQ